MNLPLPVPSTIYDVSLVADHVDVVTPSLFHGLLHFGQGERTADDGVGALGIDQRAYTYQLVEIGTGRCGSRGLCRLARARQKRGGCSGHDGTLYEFAPAQLRLTKTVHADICPPRHWKRTNC